MSEPIRIGDTVEIAVDKSGLKGWKGTVKLLDNLKGIAEVEVRKGRKIWGRKTFRIAHLDRISPWEQINLFPS